MTRRISRRSIVVIAAAVMALMVATGTELASGETSVSPSSDNLVSAPYAP